MRRLIGGLAVVAGSILGFAGVSGADPSGGFTTVNLRTCLAGDASTACPAAGELDGVTVCLARAGAAETCAETEDGEWWNDSLRHGSYRARVVVPDGYELASASCTVFSAVPYEPCRASAERVSFVVKKGVDAVNVGFLLAPA